MRSASSTEVHNKNSSMLEKFKFFNKDKDKAKSASKSKSSATRKDVTGARGDDVTDEVADGAGYSSLRDKKSRSKSRDALAAKEERHNGGSVTSASSSRGVTPGGNAPSAGVGRRGQSGNRSDSSLKDVQQRSASNSASKLSAAASQEKSSLPKAKGSVSASSFSSMSAASGSSLPKPASAKQTKDKSKMRSSTSRDGLTQGQPARRSASMSAATAHAARGPLPPGQRAPAGMPQSRPPTAHYSFLPQVSLAVTPAHRAL